MLTIQRKKLGEKHPSIITTMNNIERVKEKIIKEASIDAEMDRLKKNTMNLMNETNLGYRNVVLIY